MRKKENDIKKAQALIERLDTEIAELQKMLTDENVTSDYEKLMEYTGRLEELQSQQEEAFLLWQELEEQ